MKDWRREMTARRRKRIIIWAGISLLALGAVQAFAADTRLMFEVVRCESGFKHDAVGDDGVSRGIAQFRKETFYEFAAMAKKQGKWKFGKPHWLNPQQQMFLLEWGIDNGYGNRWTCYRKLKNLPAMDSTRGK